MISITGYYKMLSMVPYALSRALLVIYYICSTDFPGDSVKRTCLPMEMQIRCLGGKIPWRRAWQPTPVFLLREFYGRGAWQAIVHRFAESDMTEVS